ncbi:MAG: VWA domain-containing protein [Thermodesulfovibrio sp.]|nr:VWA domain-containing protein [Thermodesulfovibrio sp.]
MQSLKKYKINFFNFIDQENAKLALILNIIEPKCGGLLLAGKKGAGKSTLIKAFREILKLFQYPSVAPLVLTHRKRSIELSPEESEHEDMLEKSDNSKKDKDNREHKNTASTNQESYDVKSQGIASSEKEETFPVGESYNVKRFILKKDRITRKITGRRTKTKTKGRGGRYIRSLIQERSEVAIDATLRAAAPFQKLRERVDRLIILDDDLRYKEKERKMSHFVIFVVDGSGSMGVEQRMTATKGAVFSLLMDCYQKRDKVSMIVFRKDKAEIVLPPTSSVELAFKKLKDIPTGGKTPLSAGLLEAYKLIRKIKLKQPQSRFLVLVLTDGKANVSLSGKNPVEELKNICLLFKDNFFIDFIVIDTEKKNFMSMDLALNLSIWLGARYFTLEDLKAETIFQLIKSLRVS